MQRRSRHARVWIDAWTAASLVAGLAGCGGPAAEMPDAVALAVGERAPSGLLRGAEEAGGAHWRPDALRAQPPADPAAPDALLDAMYQEWANVEFTSCLLRGRAPELQLPTLLRNRQRTAAARMLGLSAGCALGADDRAHATTLLQQAIVSELDVAPTLREMTVELQQLFASVTVEVRARGRAELSITTQPANAEIEIDGVRCAATPCAREVILGEHVVVARHVGSLARTETVAVERPVARTLALDPAPADEQRAQVAGALAAGVNPESLDVMRAAANALGVPVVLLAYGPPPRLRLALFDAREGEAGRLVARARATGPTEDEIARATRSVVDRWRELEPRAVYEDPWFWVIGALIVGVGAGIGAAIAYEPPTTYTIQGR
ncbi:MAG: PEGA domain-containing protein [Sandaracinaceae bacterium]